MGCVNPNNNQHEGPKTGQSNNRESHTPNNPLKTNKPEQKNSEKILKKIIDKINEKSKNKNKLRYDRIFRASQNKFKASAFHQNCNKRSNTIFLAVTSDHCVFGGYTPCQWKKDQLNQYQTDEKCLSFLFKVENQNIVFFNLQEHQKSKAICNNQDCGPIFGQGHDLYISDECDKRYSWANLGKSYETKHRYGSMKSNSELCGLEKFKIKDYFIWAITQGTN